MPGSRKNLTVLGLPSSVLSFSLFFPISSDKVCTMNTTFACLLLGGGLIILWKAADVLVSGAVGLAGRLGISSLVVGLTVVAMGTSAPEVATSIAAALDQSGDIALGNVYGSNIANLALVAGITSLIMPIAIRRKTLKREIPVMLFVAVLLWPIIFNLSLSRTGFSFLQLPVS